MDASEFMEQMMEPGMGDDMAFRIVKAHPEEGGTTFSMEAVDGMTENLKAFVMARTLARWKATGKPPSRMTATVHIDWEDDSDPREGPPWWQVDDEGKTALDGEHRVKATLAGW